MARVIGPVARDAAYMVAMWPRAFAWLPRGGHCARSGGKAVVAGVVASVVGAAAGAARDGLVLGAVGMERHERGQMRRADQHAVASFEFLYRGCTVAAKAAGVRGGRGVGVKRRGWGCQDPVV